ncbi:MAG: SDR family NAD(P)-dependent oxidoreductase [Alphaproteobacteria bacterium]
MSKINPNGILSGKVALVTGASRGIGEAIALRYAMEGARVAISARTQEEGSHQFPGSINSIVGRIKAAGGEALGVKSDLSIPAERERLIRTIEDKLGPVDILCNNAAVTFFIPIETFPEARWRLMFEVQVNTPLHLSQLVIPGMKAKGAGWIVNLSSHAAIHPKLGAGLPGSVVYGMCKAALERFSTGLASELHKDKIAVNAMSPGLVATPGAVHHKLVNDANREMVTPVEDVAQACLRLSCNDPTMISGRVSYAADIMKEFGLTAAQLIA